MKTLDKNAYREISVWFHRNARPLEMALWNYYEEGGSKEAVFEALSYYQNDDGGFGNGVEPDCWNTASSPYATLTVIGLLKCAGLADAMGTGHPITEGILTYLESGAECDEDGWFFTVRSNDEFPRAPWHTYNEEENKLQAAGITAGICSFILSCAKPGSRLYQKAMDFTKLITDRVMKMENFGEMGAGMILTLLSAIEQCRLSDSFPCGSLKKRVEEVVNNTIERNPERWSVYTPRPSDFIESPANPLYEQNREIVEAELDYLIDTRNPGGVWNITWSWFDLGEKYAREFAVSENWWMAYKAIEKVRFLRSFGRIEE